MPIPANRTVIPDQSRNFGRFGDTVEVPNLTDIQIRSYERFLQLDIPPEKREPLGLEGVLREIFPIESYDMSLKLDYIKYELGKPRYDPDECRQLRLTYGRPFRVWLRLRKSDGTAVEEEVYLGDMPIMIGGGEFIINGAERVVVSQLHRSPGVDFVVTREADKDLHSCRIIPERGSWIEINATKKDTLGVRIDQSGKFSAVTLLRAMDPAYSSTASIIQEFFETEKIKLKAKEVRARLVADPDANVMPMIAADDVIDPETGEVYLDAGKRFTADKVDKIMRSQVHDVLVIPHPKDEILINSIAEDIAA